VDLGDKNIAAPLIVGVAALAVAGVGGYYAYSQLLDSPRSVIFRPSEQIAEAAAAPPAPVAAPPPASKPAPKGVRPVTSATAKSAPVAAPDTAAPAAAAPAAARPTVADAHSMPEALPPAADTTAPPEAVYGPDDRDVAPPVIVNAGLGMQRLTVSPDRVLEIELVVNREGRVESAYIVPDSSATLSDAMLSTFALHAIREWRFHPAVRYGSPVRYRQSLWLRGNGEPIDHP
jgi:hypothetical protein